MTRQTYNRSIIRKALFAGPALLALTVAGMVSLDMPSMAQATMADTDLALQGEAHVSRMQQAGLMGVLMAGDLAGKKYDDAEALQLFYAARDYAPAWVRGHGRYQRRAERVLAVLEESWTHGLNPEKYRVAELRALLEKPYGAQRAELELAMSDAVLRYGRDMLGMRLKPDSWEQKPVYWREALTGPQILEQIASSFDPQKSMRDLEPVSRLYQALRQELAVIGGEKTDAARQGKIDQILANMERLRWMGDEKPDRYVLVNIPSATLWAVDEGEVALEMPVIVGKPKRPTPSFRTEITGVRFNPNWTVPPTIKKVDFLPMLQEDPYALSYLGIELIDKRGPRAVTLDPGQVDWMTISRQEFMNIRMVQAPGENNPLGQFKVEMENPYGIYLHDTNKPEFFEMTDRALSSGCVRVADPEGLSAFLLKGNKDWSAGKMAKIVASGRMRDIKVESSLPVYIVYQTVWQDAEGRVVFGPDVYGRDGRLAASLRKDYAFKGAPQPTEVSLTF